jgi:hypothetical protein
MPSGWAAGAELPLIDIMAAAGPAARCSPVRHNRVRLCLGTHQINFKMEPIALAHFRNVASEGECSPLVSVLKCQSFNHDEKNVNTTGRGGSLISYYDLPCQG